MVKLNSVLVGLRNYSYFIVLTNDKVDPIDKFIELYLSIARN